METEFYPIAEPRVVYAVDGVIIVAKPAGMHCAPSGRGDPAVPGDTLCDWLFERYPATAAVGGRGRGEGGLLHRLDGATSGLVAFAEDDASFAAMSAAAASGAFVKTYRALCLPAPVGLAGSRPELYAPPGTDPDRWRSCLLRGDASALSSMLAGRAIESRFRPYGPGAARVACAAIGQEPGSRAKDWTRDPYRSDVVSARPLASGILAEVRLTRGFRHQVRAHMAWLGLPLEGDGLYGDGGSGGGVFDDGVFDDEATELRLRAFRLSFPSPRGGGPVVVDISEPC